MEQVFTYIGAGVLGLWIYIVITLWSKKEIGSLWSKAYWVKTKNQTIGTVLILTTIAVLIKVIPNAGNMIEGALGFSVTTQLASFVSLGWFLGSSGNKLVLRKETPGK